MFKTYFDSTKNLIVGRISPNDLLSLPDYRVVVHPMKTTTHELAEGGWAMSFTQKYRFVDTPKIVIKFGHEQFKNSALSFRFNGNIPRMTDISLVELLLNTGILEFGFDKFNVSLKTSLPVPNSTPSLKEVLEEESSRIRKLLNKKCSTNFDQIIEEFRDAA